MWLINLPFKGPGLLALFFLILSNTLSGQAIKERKVVISGKVIGFEKMGNTNSIRLSIQSLVNDGSPIVSEIDSKGKFSFTVGLAYSQNVIIHYGNAMSLLCQPGDNLNLIITSQEDGQYIADVSGGSLAKENKLMQQYLQLRDKRLPETDEQNIIKHYTPVEYQAHINKETHKERLLLKEFSNSGNLTAFFIRWAEDYQRYSAWNKLLKYCWEHPMLNNQKKEDFQVPASYFHFLGEYNMNDITVISTPHAYFLNELYMRLLGNLPPFYDASFERAEESKNILDMITALTGSIQKHSTGFTRHLFLARLYIDLLNGHQLQEFSARWNDTLIRSAYFKAMVKEKQTVITAFLKNQNTKQAVFTTIRKSPGSAILDSIQTKFRGKVIYIDFWAPWCGPCLAEMPASRMLQEEYLGKEIVFLFLSNRSSETSWKATIANYNLTGHHINLTTDQYNFLGAQFKIEAIPHYVIIDKSGSVVNENAPRPGKKAELKAELDRLLK